MFKKILKEKGVNTTKQRIAILEALQKISRPTTIDILQRNISLPINVSTLYRSLSLLVEKGIVYQTDFRESVAYFELQNNSHHHHLACVKCKNRQETSFCPQIPKDKIFAESGFVINNHVFEIFGICKKCVK